MRPNLEVRIRVSNLEESISFYEAALKPVGLSAVGKREDGLAVGFGFKRICKARIFLWLIAPGAPLTFHPLGLPSSGTISIKETDTLLGTQSLHLLEKGDDNDDDGGVTKNVHVSLPTFKRANVDRFYARAVTAGARGVLAPERRPSPYNGRWYYNAVVQDSDGRSIEVACRTPPIVSGSYGWISRLLFLIVLSAHALFFIRTTYQKAGTSSVDV